MGSHQNATTKKCEAIVKRIIEHANGGQEVVFLSLDGGNSTQLHVGHQYADVGNLTASWDSFIDGLLAALYHGPGADWHEKHTASTDGGGDSEEAIKLIRREVRSLERRTEFLKSREALLEK